MAFTEALKTLSEMFSSDRTLRFELLGVECFKSDSLNQPETPTVALLANFSQAAIFLAQHTLTHSLLGAIDI